MEVNDEAIIQILKSHHRTDVKYSDALKELKMRYQDKAVETIDRFTKMPALDIVSLVEGFFHKIDTYLVHYQKGMKGQEFMMAQFKNLARQNYKPQIQPVQKPLSTRTKVLGGLAAAASVFAFVFAINLNNGGVGVKAGTVYTALATPVNKTIGKSQITLSPSSLLINRTEIRSGKMTADLELKSGSVECQVQHLKEGEYFRIETPRADLSVVGTKFTAFYDSNRNKFTVNVTEGVVMVNDKLKGTNYYVKAKEIIELNTNQHTIITQSTYLNYQNRDTNGPQSSPATDTKRFDMPDFITNDDIPDIITR